MHSEDILDETPLPPAVTDYGWEQSAEIGDFMGAFATAQAGFTDPKKDKQGQYGKHATMAGVYEAMRPHLNKNGIAVVIAKSADHAVGTVSVSVRFYKGAQFIGCHASTPIKADRQSYIWAQASGWTYLERYLTSGLSGVAPDDDDDGAAAANEANPNPKEVQQQHQKKTQPAKTKPEEVTPETAAAPASRTAFFNRTKELGWGLAPVKVLLTKLYKTFDTSALSPEQLESAINIMSKGAPDEVIANLEPAEAA